MELKTILHATDFSDASRQALDLARKLARFHQARLHILHVELIPETGYGALDITGLSAQIASVQAEHSDEKLKELAGDDDNVVLATARHNRAALAISDYAERHNIDLIVVGSHGYSGFNRLLLGSEAHKLVRLSTAPVLVVRSGVEVNGTHDAPFANLLAPVDLSDASKAAMQEADSLAKRYGSKLVVMHSVDVVMPTHYAYVPAESQIPQAQSALSSFVAESKLDTHPQQIVVPGPAAMGITETAQSQGTDLIVLARSGLSGWQRLLVGSTTERVLNNAECAVLVLPVGKE